MTAGFQKKDHLLTKKIMRTALYFLLLSFLCGCSGISITGIEKTADFQLSKYKTFDFYNVDVSGDAVSPNSKQNLEFLKTAISKQLQAKGLTMNTTDPDLLVNIGVVVLEKVQTRETRLGEYPTYMGTRNYTWERQDIEVGRYREGTVTVHLVEADAKKMVWKGAAEGVVPENPDKVPAMIDQGMEQLFAKVN
jgi:hypothetical protein